jgi:hypothetical protein
VATAVRRATVLAAAALALGACASTRIVNGIFHAETGYRVALPGQDWVVVPDSRADLELRHRAGAAGMLVNGLCDPAVARRRSEVLARHLVFGLRDRTEVERGTVPVNGRMASHQVLEGRMPQREERVRVESYTLRGERCVYDLVFVASPEAFASRRGDFQRFVESFAHE